MAVTCPACGAQCADTAVWCVRCHAEVADAPVVRDAGADEEPSDDGDERTVGWLLGLGILLFPYLFGWLVLRRGHSTLARAVTFGWLALCLVIVAVTQWRKTGFARTGGDAASYRPAIARSCRDKRLPVDCECFAESYTQQATVEQIHELAQPTPSQAVTAIVAAAARQCADKAAVRQSFLKHCTGSAPVCECVVDRSLATFPLPEFLEMDEAYGNGRPPGSAFGAILNECAADPTSRGPMPGAAPPTPADAPPTPPPGAAWTVTSADGHATLTQAPNGQACAIACSVGSTEVWRELRDCEDTAGNPHFVANDCERWIVFFAYPRPGPALATRYMTVYDRGTVAWHVAGAGLVRNQDSARSQRHLVVGLGGTPGQGPRYSLDGRRVEFTTIENAPQVVPLHKGDPPKPPKPVKTPKKGARK